MNFLKKTHDRTSLYATRDDFRGLFNTNSNDLMLLSLLLTGNRETAARCFVAGLEDSVHADSVFKEWAHTWAKRTIILSAIRTLQPHPENDAASLPDRAVPEFDIAPAAWKSRVEIRDVLALNDFNRLVFVLCVLEGYSEHHCALLLACTPREVRNARDWAMAQIIKSTGAGVFQNVSA